MLKSDVGKTDKHLTKDLHHRKNLRFSSRTNFIQKPLCAN